MVAQFEFAARVRKRREELGLPAAAVSKHLGFTRNFYSAVENSRSLLATAKLPLLIEVLEFDDADAQTLTTLLEQARTPGWWQPYVSVLSDAFVQFLGLEYGSSEIRSYESIVFNGLLQCPEYAAAVINTSPDVSVTAAQRALEVRVRRQRELFSSQDCPQMTFLMSEAVIWQQYDGPNVLIRQLEHVLEVAERLGERLDLRIRTFETTPMGLDTTSTLVILDFPNRVGSLAYRESGGPIGITDESTAIDRFKLHYELALQSALPRSASLDMVEGRLGALSSVAR